MATSLAGLEEELAVRIQTAFQEARHPFVGYEYFVTRNPAADKTEIVVRAILPGGGNYYYAQLLTGKQVSAAATVGVLLKDVCELAVRKLCEQVGAPEPYEPEVRGIEAWINEAWINVPSRLSAIDRARAAYGLPPVAETPRIPRLLDQYDSLSNVRIGFPKDESNRDYFKAVDEEEKDRFELLDLGPAKYAGVEIDDTFDDVYRYRELELDLEKEPK